MFRRLIDHLCLKLFNVRNMINMHILFRSSTRQGRRKLSFTLLKIPLRIWCNFLSNSKSNIHVTTSKKKNVFRKKEPFYSNTSNSLEKKKSTTFHERNRRQPSWIFCGPFVYRCDIIRDRCRGIMHRQKRKRIIYKLTRINISTFIM